MPAPVCFRHAAVRLREGDRLVHELHAGTWSLLRSGEPVGAADAAALLADRKLALRPAGDQLPGFPASLSQSWARAPRARNPCAPAPPATAAVPP